MLLLWQHWMQVELNLGITKEPKMSVFLLMCVLHGDIKAVTASPFELSHVERLGDIKSELMDDDGSEYRADICVEHFDVRPDYSYFLNLTFNPIKSPLEDSAECMTDADCCEMYHDC